MGFRVNPYKGNLGAALINEKWGFSGVTDPMYWPWFVPQSCPVPGWGLGTPIKEVCELLVPV